MAAVADAIRIRALFRDGATDVHVLMPHPMETGLRKDESGRLVPAHFITEVQINCAGRTVLAATFGRAVSVDPLLHFRFRGGQPGQSVSVAWTDTEGEQRRDDAVIVSG